MLDSSSQLTAIRLKWLARVVIASLCCIAVYALLITATNKFHMQAQTSTSSDDSGTNHYAGDASCSSCHIEQSGQYEKTAHRLTLQLASTQSILGSFTQGSNTVQTVDPATSPLRDGLSFEMDVRNRNFYQTSIASEFQDLDQTWKNTSHTEQIDLVTGSGVRGQSYLSWERDRLYELPISYWTDGRRWINSPGYPDGSQIFDRPVYPRCLECHTTYITTATGGKVGGEDHLSAQTNRYIASTLIPGITCEKCHGPGARHVALEKRGMPPGPVAPQSILNPRNFSRDRQMDLCALCHNGSKREATAPAFSYVPGQPLDAYFKPTPVDDSDRPEIHGNQVGLLKRSRCYQSSPAMTCSTCHDEHAPEKAADEYSTRCLSCHTVESCGAIKTEGASIEHRCVGCHMPVQTTNAIVSMTAGKIVQAKIRTHWIKVYR